MEKVILFGAGGFGRKALEKIGKENIYCFADNITAFNEEIEGIEIVNFDKYKELSNQYLTILSISKVNEFSLISQLYNHQIYDFLLFDEIDEWLANPQKIVDEREDYRTKHLLYYAQLINVTKNKIDLQKKFLENHLSITELKSSTGYLRKVQSDLVNFANQFFKNFSFLNISPFLVGGNLLGWVRHQDFIPWDDDLDFGLIRKEYAHLIQYFKNIGRCFEYQNEQFHEKAGFEWQKELLNEYPDEYLLLIYPEHIQIMKGTNLINALKIDFFCFDFFVDDYEFNSYIDLLKETEKLFNNVNNAKEKMTIIQQSLKKLDSVIVEKSSNLYFSMDNCAAYTRKNLKWIPYDYIYPLKTISYNGKAFLIPNKATDYIKMEYADYNQLPDEYGIPTHYYLSEYFQKHDVTVEFYLIDAFEIAHFEPIYHILRENGIYAIFILEDIDTNTVGKWFDYHTAKQILEEKELEYKEFCNPNATFAFTTQDSYVLRKYISSKKINLSYGVALNKNAFPTSKRTMDGFDYKFVQGKFHKEKCRSKKFIEEDKIFIVGYPKHYLNKPRFDKQKLRKKYGIPQDATIISYLPTWDEDTSIQKFKESFSTLKDKYFIITKPHHCTFRLESKQDDLAILQENSTIVLDGNASLEEAVNISDINICDAKSGSAMESILLAADTPTIFLYPHDDVSERFEEIINEIAIDVVTDNQSLTNVIKDAIIENKKNKLEDIDYYFDTKFTKNDFIRLFNSLVLEVRKK